MLFLSGRKDEIVPPSHMSQLYKICRSEPKIWKEFPNGDHNSTVSEPNYFDYMNSFILEHVAR